MCAYFSRRHHLAGRGDAGQDAAAATALLDDCHAQVTGSDFRQGRHRLGAQGGLYGAYFRLSRAKRLVDLMVEPMSFDRIGNLGNSSTMKARLQGEVRPLEIAQGTRVRYMDMGVFSAVAGNSLTSIQQQMHDQNNCNKRVLPALFHLRCPSQSHQRSARVRTRLTTVTSISCRSL